VLGLSIMVFYLNVNVGIYGTIWILLIAYITRFMPYGIRYNTASMLQIHKELEESAAMSGASWASTFVRAILNSLVLCVGAATIIMLVTAVICWMVVKTRIPGRWLLDNLASLPIVFPGLVLGLSIMVFYLNVNVGIYGTIWILLLAYVTRFMPYGIRYNTASMVQIHKELEESAAMSGASWASTFVRVVLPLLKPGLVAGWIYIAIVSLRELSSSILLYSPGTEVVSIMIWELWENGQYVELSALGVMLIVLLFVMVLVAQYLGGKFGVKEA